MSFSRAQQPEYRALVTAAWLAHCLREGLPKRFPKKGDAEYEDWYQRELMVATGNETSAACNAGRDYDFAMAHFEGLAMGGSIKWQMRLYSGDVKRMLYSLRKNVPEAALRAARIDEAYLLAALKKGFGNRKPWEVSRAALIVIVGEVTRHVRKSLRSDELARDERNTALGLWQENGVWRAAGAAEGEGGVPEERRPF